MGRVGHRPRLAAGTPPAGALDEQLPPQRYPIDRTPIKAPRIEAIGQLYIAVRVELQQLLRPRELRSRWQAAAQRRMRWAQASAWTQCTGGPAAIASSSRSSVPWRCPTTGTSGATRAAASLSGVR